MQKYLIGVDIGTQGTKSILFDQEMHVVASAFEVSNLISPRRERYIRRRRRYYPPW